MKAIEGFDKWRILGKTGESDDECFGIINIKKMLFAETDNSQNPTGRVLNLKDFRGWEPAHEQRKPEWDS